jgi:hypothetical protein
MKAKGAPAILVLTLLTCAAGHAQSGNFYAGALGGMATLSADGRSILTPTSSAVSLYKPENGPALNLFAGWDFSRFVSVQGNYIWNRNAVSLVSTAFAGTSGASYQEMRESAQSQATGDLLVYFRQRGSRIRPYLACGIGFDHFSSSSAMIGILTGSPALPPARFASTNLVLRVPVGLDVALGRGWAFRYSFSESLSSNPISDQLTPPGVRRLKNFQNLFGFVKHF